MMSRLRQAALLMAVLLLLLSCAAGPALMVRPAPAIENARYNVILYGGRFEGDLKSVAILEIRGGPYSIVPYAPKFDYGIVKDVDAAAALDISIRFLSGINPNYIGITKNQILGPGGRKRPVGYEIRPLYQPFVYGVSDVLVTSYRVWKDGVVRAWIDVIPGLERSRRDGSRFEHGR